MRASDGRGWSKPGTLPTGNDFLPDTDTQILLKMIAACPPGKTRDIMRACYERKINASIRKIRDLLMTLLCGSGFGGCTNVGWTTYLTESRRGQGVCSEEEIEIEEDTAPTSSTDSSRGHGSCA